MAQALEKTLRKLPQAKKIKEQMLLDAWPEVVGEEIARRTSPLYIENGCLFVLAQDSAWAQHLSMQRRKIVSALNKKVRTNILKEIRFKADGRVLATRQVECAKKDAGSWEDETVPEEEKEMLLKMIDREKVHPEWQETFFNFFLAHKKKKRWFLSQGFIPCMRCGSPLWPGSMEGENKLCLSCSAHPEEK